MQKQYHRLSLEEREEISRLLVQGDSFRDIAQRLKRDPSTVSREVRKGSGNRFTYRAHRGERRARRNARKRRQGKRKVLKYKRLMHYIHAKLAKKWSPEQIAHTLLVDYPEDTSMRISPEAIYQYLYVLPKGELKRELLRGLRTKRKRRHHQRDGKKQAPERALEDMVSIKERPPEVETRVSPGHWEGDLVLGKNRQSELGTLVERVMRFTLLVKLNNRSAHHVRLAFARKLRRLPQELKRSLTYDQGREMAEHKKFTQTTNIQVYFAHPRSPWERGTNENTNMLIRQFFPKGTDFRQVSAREIRRVQDLLNSRPRKSLGWKKPIEVMQEVLR